MRQNVTFMSHHLRPIGRRKVLSIPQSFLDIGVIVQATTTPGSGRSCGILINNWCLQIFQYMKEPEENRSTGVSVHHRE